MTAPALPAPRLTAADDDAHHRFIDLVEKVRPELFRYCARMTGSIFDGEDIVQETLARAYVALGTRPDTLPLEPWLFRIAHNAAVDFLKRYERNHVDLMAEPPDPTNSSTSPDDQHEPSDPELVEAALTRFIALPPLQRSALILKDVMGHSLAETADTMATSVSAVKAALVRARANLARNPAPPNPTAAAAPKRPATSTDERHKLKRYAQLFNARDWDALRALIDEESRLDVVTRTQRRGAAAAEYYTRYAALASREGLRAVAGWVEGKPVIALFRDPSTERPSYFVLIEWNGEHVGLIRDFRYVPYLADAAPFTPA